MSTKNMTWIPDGNFTMGSSKFYAEERPVNKISVDGFWIDTTPVTNREFARFVKATNYISVAERALDPDDYVGINIENFVPGSLVFKPTTGPVNLNNPNNWWEFVGGANWRAPLGTSKAISRDHPVVQVAFEDVAAYAEWAGKSIPTEAEWEYAAKGGREDTTFPWGNDLYQDGKAMANTWDGEFPWLNTELDGYSGTSPVNTFPKNEFGLLDMIGNVWEWTQDWWTSAHPEVTASPCCSTSGTNSNPQGGKKEASFDPQMPQISIPRKVLKGGSHLCAANYCFRYRPAARIPQMIDTSASHIGFRCVLRGRT
ncbi:MAG: formylglycine-generating enzyme family protein [Candidatus Azotimanducaceae bacterium]|uniref:Formylglycine-generating enzyme family protein n=1 Tax=OM182 bacterium TaxID=2510334 RepID=A0A520S398_9GAMM|nr:hypothetical protein [Gammaproteobacteria bacterium]RZO76952.1 MAG: formylglycine-generating enzyme family protein [OM182 bacterium]